MQLLAGVNHFMGADNARRRELRGKFNLVTAAEAHILWKSRLGHHIKGTIQESLDSAPLGQDGICQLGNWIRGSVFEPFCEPEVHRQLSEAHQNFHQFGDLIIEKLKAGDRAGAEAVFLNEYNLALHGIIKMLTVINRQIQDT